MEWKYLEFLVKQSEINDLNKDNSKQFVSDFHEFIKGHRIFEHDWHTSWDKKHHHGGVLTFEKIEESQEHIRIVFRDSSNVETNFYLSYDVYPKFAFLKDIKTQDIPRYNNSHDKIDIPGEIVGVYVSHCVSKSRWIRDIDPSKRLEDVFMVYKPSTPLIFDFPR